MSCLSEAAVLGWVEGRLSQADREAAQAHVARCRDCLDLVAATRLLHSRAPDGALVLPAAFPESQGSHSPDQRYRIGAEIGAGGMGRVFESQDLTLGRTVAIKMVRDPSSELVARFRREVAIASMLQHPSIIPVYDAGTFSDGSAFCAMRLIDGVSLDHAIESGAGVRDRLGLVRAVISAADAMAYAHSRDIIHRDLKPQNIILGPFGETIVLDWGLAKRIGDGDEQARQISQPQPGVTEVGDIVGTPAYMAPEQKRGEPADKRSDVYALGMILRQVVFGSLRPQAELNASSLRRAPKELVAIAERATQAEAEARYRSAAELAADLKRFETGQLVSARTYSRLSLLGRWAKRRSGMIVAGTLIALLAGGALISGSLITEAKRDAKLSEKTEQEAELTRDFFGLISGTARQEKLEKQQASAKQRQRVAEAEPTSPEAQKNLGRAYYKVGDTLFRTIVGKKDHDGALSNYRKAASIFQSLVSDAKLPSESARRDLARAHDAIGDVHYDLYRLKDALVSYQRAAEASPHDSRMQRVARVRYELGDDDGALRYHRAAVDRWQTKVRGAPQDADNLKELSLAHGRVASILASIGRDADAQQSYQASLATAKGADYHTNDWKRGLARDHLGLGRLLLKSGKEDDARLAFSSCAALYTDFGFSTNDAYDAACCSALAGDADTSFRRLQIAFEGSWYNTMSIANNPDFARLHTDPRWRSLLSRMDTERPK